MLYHLRLSLVNYSTSINFKHICTECPNKFNAIEVINSLSTTAINEFKGTYIKSDKTRWIQK